MRPEMERAVTEIEKVITGKRGAVETLLTAMLAGGHTLLDDVPGVGKTTLAVAVSRIAGLKYQRVQFTPDTLPSDLTGFSVYDREKAALVYQPGALIQANLLLGDEINRAPSKTQSALLEAMEERQVTVDGTTRPLPDPFLVIATQNSVGAAGTQPLPYAQMDRFMVRMSLGYPDRDAQMTLLRDRQGENPLDRAEPVLTGDEFRAAQAQVRRVTAKDEILDYITRLTMASREHPAVEVGISPRGALLLDRMAKIRQYI